MFLSLIGIEPNINIPWTGYNMHNYLMEERIDDTIKWLDELDYDLVFLYFDNPDEFMHLYGIGAAQSTAKLHEVGITWSRTFPAWVTY